MSGALVSAQSTTATPITATCPAANTVYCAGGDIIISCDSNAVGTPLNCNDMIGDHEGGLENAQCYQPATGNAACEGYGTAYAFSTTYTISMMTTAPVSSTSTAGSTLISGSGNMYSCPSANANYCVAEGILVVCNSASMGQPLNCNDVLAQYANPSAENAYCYDAMAGDGNAACAISGYAFASSTTYMVPVPSDLQSQETAYPPPSNFPFLPHSSTPPVSTPTAATSILKGEGAIRGEHGVAGLAAVIGMLAFAL